MLQIFFTTIKNGDGSSTGHKLLEAACHTLDVEFCLCKTNLGKPVLSESGLFCSLTHTDSIAMCALSDTPVGIDAEPQHRVVRSCLAERVLAPAEYQYWKNAQEPNRCFLQFWTLKEAYLKCIGTGLRGFPNDLEFDLSGQQPVLLGKSHGFYQDCLQHTIFAVCTEDPAQISRPITLMAF